MKNIVEVLRQKVQTLEELQSEVEALRIAIQLISEDEDLIEGEPRLEKGNNHGHSLSPIATEASRIKQINTDNRAKRQFP
jgi:hypothetical protein